MGIDKKRMEVKPRKTKISGKNRTGEGEGEGEMLEKTSSYITVTSIQTSKMINRQVQTGKAFQKIFELRRRIPSLNWYTKGCQWVDSN